MTVNLRAIAAEIVAESPSADPGVMVADFMARIRPEDYREALELLARDLLRDVIRDRRASANGGPPSGSRKVAAARDAWRKLLDTPEFVPSTGWIFLRDATQQQVMEMAGLRRKKSLELAEAAKRYNRIATEMQKRAVLRVADLPDDVLAPLLDERAAA